jgi:hypothetical protein
MSNGLSELLEWESQVSAQMEETIEDQFDLAPEESSSDSTSDQTFITSYEQLFQIFTPTFFILLALTVGISIWSTVLSLTYLYRAWKILQPAQPSTTPGMAVGFLFIPLFNLYWTFIAYWKWAQEWNQIRQRHTCLHPAPQANEGLFLGMAICQAATLVISIAGLGQIILYFAGMKSMCDVINFAAEQNTDQPDPLS